MAEQLDRYASGDPPIPAMFAPAPALPVVPAIPAHLAAAAAAAVAAPLASTVCPVCVFCRSVSRLTALSASCRPRAPHENCHLRRSHISHIIGPCQEKSQLHKIPPFPSPYSSFLSLSPPSLPFAPFPFPTPLFPLTSFPFPFLSPFLSLHFPFPFPFALFQHAP